MRILVIFTGGTIGCSPPDDKGVLNTSKREANADDWKSYFLLTSFKETSKSAYRDEVSFDVKKPLDILSENMTLSNWSVLLKALREIDYSLYQGVVITHGTDTLAYTAAFLGILLSGINLPVVLVAANKNLRDPLTNGHQNFNAALDFIRVANCVGVYVAFSYEREKTVIYLGTRIKQSNAYIDRYESTDGIDFGLIRNGEFFKTCDISPVPYGGSSILNSLKDLTAHVMLVQPYVGLDYSLISLECNRVKAVLHTVYHAFTACTDGGDSSSILHFARRCEENGIPLYVAPFLESLLNGAERYESANRMAQGSINFLCGHSIECAYAKMLVAVNLCTDIQQIKRFLSQTIFYENAEINY